MPAILFHWYWAEFEMDGHFFYVNAGHPAPFLLKPDGELIEMTATGMVLGFLQKADIQRAHIQMKPGSVLVMYTDGIVERQDIHGDQYELNRLQEIVQKNKDKSAAEIVDAIFDDVYKFGGAVNWEDDASVVVIKRL